METKRRGGRGEQRKGGHTRPAVVGVEHYLHRLSPLHHAPAPLLPTVDLSSATQRMSSTFSAASDEGNAASTQTTPLSSSTSSISNDTLPPNSSSQSTTSSNNPPPSTATMLHRDAYQRSLDSPSESVRYTCRRVVELESLKPRAPHSIPYTHPWPSSPSSTPSPFTSLPCPAPAASLDPSFSHVWVDYDRLRAELDAHPGLYQPSAAPGSWAQWYHYVDVEDEDGWRRTAQYVMVLDSLNFCFWPQPDYEYSDLASSLKRVLLNDPAAFSASRLLSLTESELQAWLQPLSPQQKRAMQSQTTLRTSSGSRRELPPPLVTSITPPSPFVPIPLLPSRTRALNELGGFLAAHHGSLAYDLVKAAPTATHLLTTLVAHLPSFRDHCIHPTSGMQVFFYKRAQILIGDLWGAFADVPGLCDWGDVHTLTAFADYRLPQLMMGLGLLQVGDDLRRALERREEVGSGSAVEVSLRAHTVYVVEEMRRMMQEKGVVILSLQLDWILWERGESNLDTLPPHHRTRTVFY